MQRENFQSFGRLLGYTFIRESNRATKFISFKATIRDGDNHRWDLDLFRYGFMREKQSSSSS